MSGPKTIPFRFVHLRAPGGGFSEMARFTCACGKVDDIRASSKEGTRNPEATIKRVVAMGWRASMNSISAECPVCVQRRRRAARGDCPDPKPSPPAQETAEVIMLNPKTVPTVVLTADQRLRVRAILDKHFDDGIGRWLDGYSDQKAADELKVPRLRVEEIREAAYGPIRVTPEHEAAEKAIATMEDKIRSARSALAEIDGVRSALAKLVDDATSAVTAVRKALVA